MVQKVTYSLNSKGLGQGACRPVPELLFERGFQGGHDAILPTLGAWIRLFAAWGGNLPHLEHLSVLEFTVPEFKGAIVASNCDICGKGPSFGNNVSHSMRKTRRRWNPNIQRVRTLVAGATKRQNVCSSCLKAGKVLR